VDIEFCRLKYREYECQTHEVITVSGQSYATNILINIMYILFNDAHSI
jgi:hypothetical protein